MSAELVLHEKATDESGNTIEMKIWRVPSSSRIPHGFKYSLVYIVDGGRVIGYDNGERRGDHRHIRDFRADIARYKERSHEN